MDIIDQLLQHSSTYCGYISSLLSSQNLFLTSFLLHRASQFLSLIWKYTKPCPKLSASSPSTWAIITGPTSGIGLSIAYELAQNGFNLILLSRNEQKLQFISTNIMTKYSNIQVIYHVIDAINPDYNSLMKVLSQYSISLLINNVGIHNHLPANLDQLSLNEISNIIHINCIFHVQLTSLIIPIMKNSKKFHQISPKIVNISSLTSKMVMPMLSIYSASKAFIDHWSLNLAAELEPDHIKVICLRPGLTVSPMSGIKEPSFFVPSAETMAHACVRMINENDYIVIPYWPHYLLDILNSYIPSWISWPLVRDMHQQKRIELLRVSSSGQETSIE